LSDTEKNPEIESVDPVKDPTPEPHPDAPRPTLEPPHGDPSPKEPTVNTGPPLVLTSKPVPEEKPAKATPQPKAKKQEETPEQSPFSVTVGQVYDGPLDLLLDLIRKQDIDIYDIPIAKITAQFLGYVDQLKATDVDVAGDFIYMA